MPSSWRKRISTFVVGDPEVDPSTTPSKIDDDGAEKDARVLVEMEGMPSEAWESSVSVELTNVNWASANHPTPHVVAKTNDDHLDQDDRQQPAVDSTLDGPIGVGLGIAATVSGNLLFSSGPTPTLETQVARLQASLAAKDQVIQEQAQAMAQMINEKDRVIHQVIQEKDRVIQVNQEKVQIIRDLKDQLFRQRDLS